MPKGTLPLSAFARYCLAPFVDTVLLGQPHSSPNSSPLFQALLITYLPNSAMPPPRRFAGLRFPIGARLKWISLTKKAHTLVSNKKIHYFCNRPLNSLPYHHRRIYSAEKGPGVPGDFASAPKASLFPTGALLLMEIALSYKIIQPWHKWKNA